MKTRHLLLTLLMALMVPMAMNAQQTHTVYPNGTDVSPYVPIFGQYADWGTKTEFIIPAALLNPMQSSNGCYVTKMTFYLGAQASSAWNASFRVFIKNYGNTQFYNASFVGDAGATTVYNGVLNANSSTMEVVFDQNFHYDGQSNILIGIYLTNGGNSCDARFYGVNNSNVNCALNSYVDEIGGDYITPIYQKFTPKVTFEYFTVQTPTNVLVYSEPSSGVTVSWEGNASQYNIEYDNMESIFNYYDGYINTTGNSYTFTGQEAAPLAQGMKYRYRVQAQYTPSMTSDWSDWVIYAECLNYLDLPLHANFDYMPVSTTNTANNLPGCWTYINDSNDPDYQNYPLVENNSSLCHSNYYPQGMYNYIRFNIPANGEAQYLVFPPVDPVSSNGITVSFYYRSVSSETLSSFVVGLMDQFFNTNEFYTKSGYNGGGYSTTYYQVSFTFTSEELTQHGNYLIIKAPSDNTHSVSFCIDDIDIYPADYHCGEPVNVHAESITTNSAEIVWENPVSGGGEWGLKYKKASDTEWTMVYENGITSHSWNLTNLEENTTYNVAVINHCNSVDHSEWAEASFTTIAVIDGDHPYSDNFDGDLNWVLVNGELVNHWVQGDDVNLGLNEGKALYIAKNAADDYGYDFGEPAVVYAYKTFSLAAGSYLYSFDWRANGEYYANSDPTDYLRVALVPASTILSASETLPYGLGYNCLPNDWIALDGESQLNNNDNWTTKTDEVTVPTAGDYMVVFIWRNDNAAGYDYPAAIDNFSMRAVVTKTFVTEGNWNVADNWSPSGVPTFNCNVIIQANAIIPNGTEAQAYNVTVANDKTLTVNDGGLLNATTITGTNAGANDRVVIKDGGQVKTANPFYATIEKDITGYGAENVNNSTGWYLVAPPTQVMAVPTFVPKIGSEYQFDQMDFYWFNGDQELEWYNPKCPAEGGCESPWGTIPQGQFSAEVAQPLHGYLYARQEDGTVQFAAGNLGNTPFPATNEDTNVDLEFYSNSTAPLNGWNLIGNPYTCNAYLLDEDGEIMPFYRMNDAGDAIVAAQPGTAIKPCESVFVRCTEPGITVTFTTTAPANVGEVQNDLLIVLPTHNQFEDQDASVTSITQTVALTNGANWFSINVDITLDELKAALIVAAPGTSITIKAKSGQTSYNPNNGRWSGTISWNVNQMYIITVAQACELTLEGEPVNPAEHPITIKSGANWIAYPLAETKTLTEAFAGFAVNGDQVKSKSGTAQYNRGRWQGTTLTELEPGKGYIYVSKESGDRILVFPSSAKSAK